MLGLLDVAGEATPYELKQYASSTVAAFWSIAHSQIYSEPARLEKAGYLTERREQGGRRRKRYALTAKGRKALAAWLEEPAGLDKFELRDPGLLKLSFGADPVTLAREQAEAHRARVEWFESLRSQLQVSGANEQAVMVVEAGIALEREYVRYWTRLAKGS